MCARVLYVSVCAGVCRCVSTGRRWARVCMLMTLRRGHRETLGSDRSLHQQVVYFAPMSSMDYVARLKGKSSEVIKK